jgi:hypothetical protein
MSRRFQLSRGHDEHPAPVVPQRRGPCSACGCDTELLARVLAHAVTSAEWFGTPRHTGDRRHPGLYWVRRDELLRSLGFVASGRLSETDAIGRCLCTPCHKGEAAKVATEPAVRPLFDDLAPRDEQTPPAERRRPREERVSASPSEYERRLAEIRARAAGLAVRERRFGKR